MKLIALEHDPSKCKKEEDDHPPVCIWPYNKDESVLMKAWEIGEKDKATQRSIYSNSFEDVDKVGEKEFGKRCAAGCRDTPGCFKFKLDGASTCVHAGNRLPDRNENSYGRFLLHHCFDC